jgi:hypothetical protein
VGTQALAYDDSTGGKHMSKEEALKIVRLLSALESWAFSQPNRIPDYLIDDVGTAMKILEQIILKEKNE